jgi:hypothetical protein
MEVKQGKQPEAYNNFRIAENNFYKAAVLPIFFFGLDFFCRSLFLIIVSGIAPKALIWFFPFVSRQKKEQHLCAQRKQRNNYRNLKFQHLSLPVIFL